MEPTQDADNQSILAAVKIGEALSFKAFHASAKNGHQLVAVIPKALSEQSPIIRTGDYWEAQFTPYDLSSARLVRPLDNKPEDWESTPAHG